MCKMRFPLDQGAMIRFEELNEVYKDQMECTEDQNEA